VKTTVTLYYFFIVMKSHIHDFFDSIGLTPLHADVFLLLYTYWSKPASTVAKILHKERTHIYKILQWLVRKYLVSETQKKWIKQFYIADKNVLHHLLASRKKETEELEVMIPLAENQLQSLVSNTDITVPKIQIFQWKEWIQTAFSDLYTYVISNKYLVIKLFASNTLESQWISNTTLKDVSQDFFSRLQKKGIQIQSYIWNWISLLEHIVITNQIEELEQLPAANSSINVFVVWNILYFFVYKWNPYALRIENEDIASLMHFLLNHTSTL